MAYSSCINLSDGPFVLDASVAINLIASGRAQDILAALPSALLLVPGPVFAELSEGPNGEHETLAALQGDGYLTRVDLSGRSLEIFGDLVTGSAADTLGDGEAATIAIASTIGGVVLIDERKGWRIARARFPSLRLATSVDLFAYKSVQTALGAEGLTGAVLGALERARMHVRSDQLDWVVTRIGADRAAGCSSLVGLLRKAKGLARSPVKA